MYSFVYLQIFRPRKNFSTGRKRTGKRFLASVNSHMIHQLVFSFEGFSLPWAFLPVAGMVRIFRSTDVINCQVRDNFMQGMEHTSA